MKILYVEDNPTDADLVRVTLKKCGDEFALTINNSVAEAMETLKNSKPDDFDIVMSDLHLSDGLGLSILSEIRRLERPWAVVMVTGQGDEDTAIAALKSGADDYLVKRSDYLKHLPETLKNARKVFEKTRSKAFEPMRVLYAEHNETDIDLTKRHFRNHAPQIELDIVKNAQELIQTLLNDPDPHGYQVLIMDYHLPGTNGADLIRKLRENYHIDIPVILVTGQGTEEMAVEVLKLGSTDYLVKTTGYLHRLPALLENAHNLVMLQKEKEALKQSEERFRLMAENAVDTIFRLRINPLPVFEYISPAVYKMIGYTPDEIYLDSDLVFQKTSAVIKVTVETLTELAKQKEYSQITFPFETKGHRSIWLDLSCSFLFDENGHPTYIDGIVRDITERMQNEEKLQKQVEKINALHLIDKAITSSFDIRVTFQVLLDQLSHVLHLDAASISLFDPELNLYDFLTSNGFHTPESALRMAFRHNPLPAEAVRSKKTVQISLDRNRLSIPAIQEIVKNEHFTQYWATPMLVKGQIKGVLEGFGKEAIKDDHEWRNFFESLAQQAAIALENSQNFDKLQRSNLELLQAYDETLEGWIGFLDLRDKETEGHTVRVVDLTLKAAGLFGVKAEHMSNLRRGVLLHDIGKVGIPDNILNKPGPLTDEEWVIMKKHPVLAYEMLSPIEFLKPALDVPYCHHEKWDGTGYPRGLKGKEIPLTARIFSIFDVYDALTSDRPYRKAWKKTDAVEYIRKNAGVQFDPELVEGCISSIDN